MSALQISSITLSTMEIFFVIRQFIVHNRRKDWVHPKFPPSASLVPITFLLMAAIVSGTLPFEIILVTIEKNPFPSIIPLFTVSSMLFTILVLCLPGSNQYVCHCFWKIIRTIVHILLLFSIPFSLLFCKEKDKVRCFITHLNEDILHEDATLSFTIAIMSAVIHFVLGILVFSGLNFAAIFAPFVSAMVFVLKKVINCCFSPESRELMNKRLIEILKPEEDRQLAAEQSGIEGAPLLDEPQSVSVQTQTEATQADTRVKLNQNPSVDTQTDMSELNALQSVAVQTKRKRMSVQKNQGAIKKEQGGEIRNEGRVTRTETKEEAVVREGVARKSGDEGAIAKKRIVGTAIADIKGEKDAVLVKQEVAADAAMRLKKKKTMSAKCDVGVVKAGGTDQKHRIEARADYRDDADVASTKCEVEEKTGLESQLVLNRRKKVSIKKARATKLNGDHLVSDSHDVREKLI